MTKTVKKEQAKFKARGYRFSKKTQYLLNKLTKRTKKSQNDVVRKALEGYEKALDQDKAYCQSFVDKAIKESENELAGLNKEVAKAAENMTGHTVLTGAFDEGLKKYVENQNKLME